MNKLIILLCCKTLSFSQQVPSTGDQVAGALLAAPEEFRENATVMGYDAENNLVLLKKGSNAMICVADDPDKPGFNAAAYHSDLEPFMARGRVLRAEGKSSKEIFEIREAEARSGKLKLPTNGATLHILYGPEGRYDPETQSVLNAIYRYVVYIPWATTETTGLAEKPSTPGGPWIMDAGTHRAHIMINPPAESREEKDHQHE